jgi:hypothetical protein
MNPKRQNCTCFTDNKAFKNSISVKTKYHGALKSVRCSLDIVIRMKNDGFKPHTQVSANTNI